MPCFSNSQKDSINSYLSISNFLFNPFASYMHK